jgi:hypothetical protein
MVYSTYKAKQVPANYKDLDRIVESLSNPPEPNEKLKDAAQRYLSYKSDSYLLDPDPETPELALELLKTLYVNYINDLSPYRVKHLDFFEFTSIHECLHLFSSEYNSYKLSSFNTKTSPISLESYIVLQTP